MVPGPSEKLKERMSRVRYKVAVMSGKGGVGKTTVSVNLGQALAESGARVGVLDVDIHGPNVPKMFGIDGQRFDNSGRAEDGSADISPIQVSPNLVVASVGLVGYGEHSALVWRGPMKLGIIKQFLEDVNWGDLDYLIIDTPPGTGDEVMSVCQFLPDLDGVVVVTTPQAVAIQDARRTVDFVEKMKVPLIGLVENMRDADGMPTMFGSGGGEQAASGLGVPFIGAIPLDSRVVQAGDSGNPPAAADPHDGAGAAMHVVANAVRIAMIASGSGM